jgi:ABC-type transport system involved in cytochrome bd biosynthesis fused ATPase/permease subunit
MSIITDIKNRFSYHPFNWVIIIMMVITYIIIPIIKTEFMLEENIQRFLAFEMLHFTLLTYITDPLITKIAHTIKKKFIFDSYIKYNKMTFESKSDATMTKFERILDNAADAMYLMIEWGLPQISNIIGIIVGIVWLFYRKNILRISMAFLMIFALIYAKFILPMQTQYNKNAQNNRAIRRHSYQKLKMSATPFQFKERTPKYMNSIYAQLIDGNYNIVIERQSIINYVKVGCKICTLAICYMFTTKTEFLMIFMSMNKFNQTFIHMTGFLNHYNRMYDEYDTYVEFFQTKEFCSEALSLQPTPNLTINKIDINRGKFKIYSDVKLKFFKGVKIFIRGASGSGKSTLMNGITGKIAGVDFNIGEPKNYYANTADMYQDIREKLPSSTITIRDYFQDECDNKIIEFYIKSVFQADEYKFWINMLSNKITHVFDTHLNDRISGGQKSRLILAMRSYEIDIKKKDIVILDEPEQGSDSDTIIWVLNQFFTRYHDKTIIMVSHMCKCQLNQLQIAWDYKINIDNGHIRLL